MKRTLQSLIVGATLAVGLFVGASSASAATHTVRSGDTLARLFPSTWQAVCAHYGLNCDLIFPGQVFSDDGLGSAPTRVLGVSTSQPSYSAPAAPQTIQRASGGPNGYGPGWCTWYVKERRPDIGGYWGNAGYNWITAAQNAGFATGYTPAAGAIGVMAGHVVYVESVSGNMVNISEMGWNYTAWNKNYRTVPASSFTYIY
jgi:surface antigen